MIEILTQVIPEPKCRSPYHTPIWKEARSGFAGVPITPGEKTVWLCFVKRFSQVDRAVLEASGGVRDRQIKVFQGRDYRRFSSNRYRINPGTADDYERLVKSVLNDFGTIGGVIHLWSYHGSSVSNASRVWPVQSSRTLSALWLGRALGGIGNRIPIAVNFITRGLIKKHRHDVSPSNVALAGAVGVVQKEFTNLITRTMDIGDGNLDIRTEKSLHQVLNGDRHHQKMVMKDGSWWLPDFENDDPEIMANCQALRHIKNGGVYVITGGLGGLARAIARDLSARAGNLTLVLVIRSSFPLRHDWPGLLKDPATDLETRDRIEDLVELEQRGARIRMITSDLAEPGNMASTLKAILQQHDSIDGVIHTSGLFRDSTISTIESQSVAEVFGAKAVPAQGLYDFFRSPDHPTDFVVLFSSVSTELCAFGQSDYAAANAYLDGLAELAFSKGLPFVSVSWPALEEVENSKFEIRISNFTQAFFEIVTRLDAPRTVVSALHFAHHYHSLLAERQPTRHRNPETLRSVEAPVEQMVSIWKRELKNNDLAADDDYFALGGDSLIAMKLLGRIQDTFDQTIPMSLLIKAPTPRKLVRIMGLEGMQISDAKLQSLQSPDSQLSTKNSQPNGHILPLRVEETDSAPPLFCLHGSDGGVMYYQTFARRVRKGHSIYGVECKIIYDEACQEKDIDTMARNYLADIKKVKPAGPYIFAGYSFGALVALRMAQVAEAQGDKVDGLILYDMFNPACLRSHSVYERFRVIWEQRSELEFWPRVRSCIARYVDLGRGMCVHHWELHKLKTGRITGEYARHVKARYENEALIPHFQPGTYLGRTLIVSTEDLGDKYDHGELRGWKNVFAGRLTHRFVTGNHLEIFSDPHLENLVYHTNYFLEGAPKKVYQPTVPQSPQQTVT